MHNNSDFSSSHSPTDKDFLQSNRYLILSGETTERQWLSLENHFMNDHDCNQSLKNFIEKNDSLCWMRRFIDLGIQSLSHELLLFILHRNSRNIGLCHSERYLELVEQRVDIIQYLSQQLSILMTNRTELSRVDQEEFHKLTEHVLEHRQNLCQHHWDLLTTEKKEHKI